MLEMYVCGECGRRDATAGTCSEDGCALEPALDPLLGTDVGRYRLTRVLGQGGMGRVYAAVHAGAGSRVAIKVLSERYAQNREVLDRFFAEARAVNLIKHEYIVNVLDLAQLADGRPYIVMELVEGKTLRELVRSRALPLGGVVQLAIDVLSALGAAHAIGIVHRDLKPDNVLVTASGRPKVLDFGIAKLSAALPGMIRTQAGVVLGTPEYMAPEQATGGELDARCDVYAIGVMLYEAITGKRPFDGPELEVMKAHVEREPRRPRELRAELPEELEAVILRALAKRPADRFPTAKAMATALRRAAGAVGGDQWKALSSRASWLAPAPPSSLLDSRSGHAPATAVVARPAQVARGSRPPRNRRALALALAVAVGVIALGVLLAFAIGPG